MPRESHFLLRSWPLVQLTKTLAITLVAVLVCSPTASAQDVPLAERLDFFERSVRPQLVEHCYECHSGEDAESDLRVDRRASVFEGPNPAVVPGAPDSSPLLQAIAYTDLQVAMPPDGKLSPETIAVFRRWIADGAAWPADSETDAQAGDDSEGQLPAGHLRSGTAQSHWAFQPIERPPLPDVSRPDWARNPIDRFVLHQLDNASLTPSADADQDTLIRRAYLDITGLPPSAQQLRLARTETWPSLVDRLLSSPSYGVRWGRHWLDVARYADTKGYVDGGQRRFAYAYTYRDYVIRAWNQDLSFDQFIYDQLAADLNPNTPRWRMAGMGFLTVGRRFNHNYYDTLDDRIDVIARGLTGLTMACARCHDHKYDPIPTADYYSLYGILANSEEPPHAELPILDEHGSGSVIQQELDKRTAAYRQRFQQLRSQIQHELRAYCGDYFVYLLRESPAHRSNGQNPLKTDRTILRAPSAYGYGAIRRWRRFLAERGQDDPVLGVWRAMEQVPAAEFSQQLELRLKSPIYHPLLVKHLRKAAPANMLQLVQAHGSLLEGIDAQWRELIQQAKESGTTTPRAFPDPQHESLRQILYGADSPATVSNRDSVDCYSLDEHVELRNLAGKIEEHSVKTPGCQPRAMVLQQGSERYQPVVFQRGHPNRPGAATPLQVPVSLGWQRQPTSGSATVAVSVEPSAPLADADRLQLAAAIVHPDHPLTSRVIVNRVWAWHFGRGLVASPSDFGRRCPAPRHQALLDYLADWLVQHDWSIKALQRLIITSSTYRQSSQLRQSAWSADPQTELWWRFPPRRLEWEAVRDSLLFVAGQLDESMGGPPVESAPDSTKTYRRTVFLDVDRQHLARFAQYFDFPPPDFSSPQRATTTVPQQQLFFLNSPFVLSLADQLGQWAAKQPGDEHAQFRALHRRIFAVDFPYAQREIDAVLNTLQQPDGDQRAFWSGVAHTLLQQNHFIVIP